MNRLLALMSLGLAVLCPASAGLAEESPAPTSLPPIIAHRGASKDAPENTMAAFRLAWLQKADAIELDIHLTKDGRIVVCHDANTKKTTGVDKTIAQSTLEELRTLDAGSFKGPQWKGEKLPTLEEVLAEVPQGKQAVIEVKCGPEALPELQRVLRAWGKAPTQAAVISFKEDVCAQAKKLMPDIPVWLIVSVSKDLVGAWKPAANNLIRKAKAAGLDGLDLGCKSPLDPAYIRQVKAAGLKCFVWTIDDAALARSLAAAGVDGITTNRPEWVREQLRSPAPASGGNLETAVPSGR